ncbi:hypothetical protein B484DRAFT_455604 [Ochromonadaceae sp. CCMP2298]|nr:hypothetical protein B484DRAFT_455604 [Ochromonadaceae sp. CCMP2298]|mmetsp:Transcript_29447/g.63435  ORF Transcript_29447/g.63435 Transcript_29447/m.63435 type:complete len:470 (-) Transcript_29447:70-1479(-)|eukprot:CAMPEP_0173193906 /NCGR_PEP_ID=MMETSP1141-20130122/14216_1 /TAXON_ID=483371 /ORGANISM="non described non described, Strain CCMP2298" /LENGTH=469 /DNA_ID=CAMNT_0014118289 /DNA_START=77 /DNA_END=1486 /DNA_ORIENTATION=+
MDDQAAKRFRPDEILDSQNDPNRVITRLLVNRQQFSKIIGKGGAMISHIRSSTGGSLRGADLDEENRLVLIAGTLSQVMKTFDMVSEIVVPGGAAGALAAGAGPAESTTVFVLLENSRAGKVVGAKGTMLQLLKQKSGAQSLGIEKEPLNISGVSLRKVWITGSLYAVRRAHYLILELFADPNALFSAAAEMAMDPLTMTAFSQSLPQMMLHQHQQATHTSRGLGLDHHGGLGGLGLGHDSDMLGKLSSRADAMSSSGLLSLPSLGLPRGALTGIPLQSLGDFGLQEQTVRQLVEMRGYLLQHFGLEMVVTKSDGASQGVPAAPKTVESALAAKRISHPTSLCFSVPLSCVGGLIGRGGQTLRDLHLEFGVRVYIEKEEFAGQRIVVLSYTGQQVAPVTEAEGAGVEDEEPAADDEGEGDVSSSNKRKRGDDEAAAANLSQCKERIEAMVQDLLKEQKPASPSAEPSPA